MKKLVITVAMTIASMVSFGDYQVYDVKLNAKTTKAKGMVESCEETYAYRDKSSAVIRGVIGGCGCEAVLANGNCKNAIVYMWDETHKIPITNVTSKLGQRVKRIGKKQTVIENYVHISARYGLDDMYGIEMFLAGFGTYKAKENTDDSYVANISGNFAGIATAPYYVKAGKVTACSCEDDTVEQTKSFEICTECEEAFDPEEVTPFYGTYSVKYNSGKVKKIKKNGFTASSFGLPSYVGIEDYALINIEE